MKRFVVTACVASLVTSVLPAPGAAQDAKAQEIVKKMRAAIGGESRIASLKSLTAAGTYRRVAGDRDMSGELEWTFAAPDKLLRRETMELPNGMPGPALVVALNGAEAWRNVEEAPAGHGGGMIMIRRAPEAAGGNELNGARAEMTRLFLSLLGQSPSSVPVTFTHAGTAEAPDGTAEALDVKGDGIDARLYVDSTTYLPVMLAYKGIQARVRTRTLQAGQGHRPDPAEMERRIREEQQAAGTDARPPLVDMQLFIGDHKNVDGLMLPHRFSISVGDRTSEEWEITSYKTNVPVDAAMFKKPAKAS